MEDYKLKATNPFQYDSPELDWRDVGSENDSSRKEFRKWLLPVLENLKGKSVLDIGSGVGQLFPTLQNLGASDIQGIEPSQRNVSHSKDLYPNIQVHHTTLQDFESDKLFDVVICIMVFEHILDIEDAFSRIAKLTKPGGNFYLIIGDKEYNTQNRLSSKGIPRTVDIQELGNEVVAVKTLYGNTISYDIFRPLESVIGVGESIGFKLDKRIDLINSKDKIHAHLLVFKMA
jgi:SAM-dependent methyltransferase